MKRTRAQIKSKIDSYLTTNGNGDITGAQHNDLETDIKDSFANLDDDAYLFGVREFNEYRFYPYQEQVIKSGAIYQCSNLAGFLGVWNPSDFVMLQAASSNLDVIGQLLTGYVISVGAISSSDSILTSIQKLAGNVATLNLSQVLVAGNDAGNNYMSNLTYIEYGQSTINIQNSELKYGPGAAALNWNTKILSGSHWDYDSDYSGTYTTRSLVDKGYVTSAIASGVSAYLQLAGGTLSGDVLFTGGKGIDTTATGGTDTLNIGGTNADVINIGRAGATVNVLGSALYEYAANQYVLDKLITLNYNGAVGSGAGVGFEIEENSTITGYLKTNITRDGFVMLAPANSYGATLSLASLANDRTYILPDASGTIALTSDLTSGYIPYTGATTNVNLGVRTLTNSTNITSPLIYGSSAINGVITIEGTSSATKTTSYVNLQPTGGNVGIGTVNPLGTLSIVSTNTTGTTTSSSINLTANSLTSGHGLYLASSSLTSGRLLDINVSGTAATNNQAGVRIDVNGATSTAAQTTSGLFAVNSRTNATSGTNVAAYFGASGATTGNYAIIVPSTGGSVGIGISVPLHKLHIETTTTSNAIAATNLSTTGDAYGAVFRATGSGAANNFGMYAQASGAATANYNMYSGSLAAGVNNYSIYSLALAKSYFAGAIAIGTNTVPIGHLHIEDTVAGSVTAHIRNLSSGSGSYTIANFGNDAAVGRAQIFLNSSANTTYGGAQSLNVFNIGEFPVTIGTSNTVRMTVDAIGNIGIGAVTTSTHKLHITDTSIVAGSRGLHIDKTGIVAGSNYGIVSNVIGASTSNYAGYFVATGATNNYAIVVPTGSGDVGFGTITPTAPLHLVSTLANTAGLKYGQLNDITGAGTTQTPVGMRVNLLAGYTGSNFSIGGYFNNLTAGTAAAAWTSVSANWGVFSDMNSTTVGHNVAVAGQARGSSVLNIGVHGYAYTTTATENIGVVGQAFASTSNRVGGFFYLGSVAPTAMGTSVALMADNGTTAAPIFIARDNGTEVLRIADGGNTGFGVLSPTGVIHLKAGTATASTAPLKFTAPAALLATPEALTVEPSVSGDALHFTITTGAARKTFAFLESPVFTGAPNLPTGSIGVTQAAGTSSTTLATTAFVTAAIAGCSNIYEAILSLTSAQILALYSSPITIIAAPGAGKYIEILSTSGIYTWVSIAYNTNTNLVLAYAGATTQLCMQQSLLTSTSSRKLMFANSIVNTFGSGLTTDTQILTNTAVQVSTLVGNTSLGDGTAKLKVLYRIVTE
ncbi:MAG: hypothetical protein K8R85_11120 [Bacteroidetes bacterium]|nr:hypothetical protein [Bacteroidota bacterium]